MLPRYGIAQASLDPLLREGLKTVVFGYGNQGRAQALNLRDSGVPVRVALRPGSASVARVGADGLEAVSLLEGARVAGVAALLVPDEAMPGLVDTLAGHWQGGVVYVLAHGYNVTYGRLRTGPDARLACVAPAGPGTQVRARFLEGGGVTAFLCLSDPDDSELRSIGLAYAAAIGCARAGIFECTFGQETEVDLFGEQAVLCGGLSSLVQAAFHTLVDSGYPPEMAYLECVRQVGLTAQLITEGGVEGMRDRISPTALFGDLTRGPRLAGPELRATLRAMLEEIRTGRFAEEWNALAGRGRTALAALREDARDAELEAARLKLEQETPLAG